MWLELELEYQDILYGSVKSKIEIARRFMKNLETREKLKRDKNGWLRKRIKMELDLFYQVTRFFYVCTIDSVIVKWKYIIIIIIIGAKGNSFFAKNNKFLQVRSTR